MSNIKNARILRKNLTPQEQKIWGLLRKKRFHTLRFRRQEPIGPYIVDFLCVEKKLIIEIDGGQHNTPEQHIYDKERTLYLERLGYHVLRFWNNEVNSDVEIVMETIYKVVAEN
ncbi:endonuclease domain-containing protein [Legionella shakespearei]|uniref:Multidrug efflux protein n=1 Tax=Legionella shakespearei DSM 23087 TaxID=1122169 RepID=A0A0W0YLW1_9GAMM|nr:endonuclease domain-containing protein [Legionella shakespearei]KTD57916.1 multidrug efflux protein [Legionella shakespearei DSM 23087]